MRVVIVPSIDLSDGLVFCLGTCVVLGIFYYVLSVLGVLLSTSIGD
jgi:hypothetical protein